MQGVKPTWSLTEVEVFNPFNDLLIHLSVIQIQYHKDFEAAKGHYTAVADDPETKRAQQSSKIASQVAYTQHSSGQSRLGIQQRSEEGRNSAKSGCTSDH